LNVIVRNCSFAFLAGFLLVSPLRATEAEEDLLGDEDLSFYDESNEMEKHWSDDFKVTLGQSQMQIQGGIHTQRSVVRLEFEKGFSEGWYAKIDGKYRRFWEEDQLATQRGNTYSYGQVQQAWLQYSNGACVAKAGRQTLIWGEVEGTFAVDIVTPFDYTEQLLTDYSNIRLAQDLILTECYFGSIQTQVFYVSDAKTDLFRHSDNQFPVFIAPGAPPLDMNVDDDAGQEWGGRLKWVLRSYDLSFMIARLYENSPTLVSGPSGPEAEIAFFNLYGISSSLAYGRLLLKLDSGYKTDQLIAVSENTSDRYDLALGFEYTNASNHNFNGGVWRVGYTESGAPEPSDILTFGWSKTCLNEDLALSLLTNWASEPSMRSATINADYQWDDFWNISMAIGVADNDDSLDGTALYRPDRSLTFAIKYEL